MNNKLFKPLRLYKSGLGILSVVPQRSSTEKQLLSIESSLEFIQTLQTYPQAPTILYQVLVLMPDCACATRVVGAVERARAERPAASASTNRSLFIAGLLSVRLLEPLAAAR